MALIWDLSFFLIEERRTMLEAYSHETNNRSIYEPLKICNIISCRLAYQDKNENKLDAQKKEFDWPERSLIPSLTGAIMKSVENG